MSTLAKSDRAELKKIAASLCTMQARAEALAERMQAIIVEAPTDLDDDLRYQLGEARDFVDCLGYQVIDAITQVGETLNYRPQQTAA